MAKIIRPRGDIKTNWAAKNPVLNIREMGIEWEETVGVGKVKLKFGNGISRWNDLDYAVIPDHSAILYNTKPGWETENPILKVSEMGVEWESAIGEGEINLKFGDGITPWNELAYGLVSDITDKKINTITSPPESDVNPVLDAGDTVGEAAGKLNRQQGFLKTTLGYDRLDALAATLEGLEHQDFVGILNYLNDRKLNKSDVYNGTDSASEEKAASANAVRIVKELADNNAEGISLLNSNLAFEIVQNWNTEYTHSFKLLYGDKVTNQPTVGRFIGLELSFSDASRVQLLSKQDSSVNPLYIRHYQGEWREWTLLGQ